MVNLRAHWWDNCNGGALGINSFAHNFLWCATDAGYVSQKPLQARHHCCKVSFDEPILDIPWARLDPQVPPLLAPSSVKVPQRRPDSSSLVDLSTYSANHSYRNPSNWAFHGRIAEIGQGFVRGQKTLRYARLNIEMNWSATKLLWCERVVQRCLCEITVLPFRDVWKCCKVEKEIDEILEI